MKAQVIAACFALGSGAALAQAAIYKDQFLEDYPAGTPAVVVDNVATIREARRVIPLEPESTISFGRRSRCLVAIAHREPDLQGKDTYVGVQVVKLFSAHDSPGAVYVARNSGWLPRIGNKELPELNMSEVFKASLPDFAAAHANGLKGGLGISGKGQLGAAWHARIDTVEVENDSASEANVRFWAEDPLHGELFKKVHAATLQRDPDVRVENHLVRFKLTADKDPSKIPSLHFDCRDQRLLAVAIRAYVPFGSSYSKWGHLTFK